MTSIINARRDKKGFLNEQCKETEENNKRKKTSNFFKKIGELKGTFCIKIGMIKGQEWEGPNRSR